MTDVNNSLSTDPQAWSGSLHHGSFATLRYRRTTLYEKACYSGKAVLW